jgi:hypothetical protein
LIDYLENQESVDKLRFSTHLERSAKDFFRADDAEDRLAERVETYTGWDGELDELVHYTRRGVNGRDVLMNIMLSDDRGSTCNKDIIFGYDFKYVGAKIGINGTTEYCVVLDYASNLGQEQYKQVLAPRKYLSSNIFRTNHIRLHVHKFLY